MAGYHNSIEHIEVGAYTIPTDAPEGDGTLDWDATTIVVVHAHFGGKKGLGYTYADLATAKLIQSKLASVVAGMGAAAPRRAPPAFLPHPPPPPPTPPPPPPGRARPRPAPRLV